jgi:hypothetical protein
MSLNSPVIAGAPVTTRADTKTVVGILTSTVPPGSRVFYSNGRPNIVQQSPVTEGQMLFYRNGQELFVTMYVVVLHNNELQWKQVQNWGFVQDPRTGLEKDPLLDFYSTLAY